MHLNCFRLYNRDGSKQAAGDYKECYDVIPARQVPWHSLKYLSKAKARVQGCRFVSDGKLWTRMKSLVTGVFPGLAE